MKEEGRRRDAHSGPFQREIEHQATHRTAGKDLAKKNPDFFFICGGGVLTRLAQQTETRGPKASSLREETVKRTTGE